MKPITLQILLFLLCGWEMSAQQATLTVPKIDFQRCLGGSGYESAIFTTITSTGDYLFIGNTASQNGDVVGNHGGNDIWTVKVDASGTILSQACYGGSNDEYVSTVKDLGNDEYLLNGTVGSGDGNVVGYSGSGQDIWVLKINASGTILSQQCATNSAMQTILLSNNKLVSLDWVSSAGSASNYHGGIDTWIKVTDMITGNVLVNQCYGGTGDDKLKTMWKEGNAIVLAGATNSTDGDIVGQHGGYDIWTIKIDTLGNILNQNVLGGSDQEYFKRAYKNSFGNYVIDAYSGSRDGSIGNFQPDTFDMNLFPWGTSADSVCQFWSLMLDNSLTLKWEKTFPNLLLKSAPVYLNEGFCFENDIQVQYILERFTFNTKSLPTDDGGLWIIGQTFPESGSGFDVYYYSITISASGSLQSNAAIYGYQAIYEDILISMSYSLASNTTMQIHYNTWIDYGGAGAGWLEKHEHRLLNTLGQHIAMCDTETYIAGGSNYTTYNTVGNCPIAATTINPAYHVNDPNAPSTTSSIANDTCSSGTFTHISKNDSTYNCHILGQSNTLNWTFDSPYSYIYRLDCLPDGVFGLGSTSSVNPQAVGHHGSNDFWLLKIQDPNNLYGGKLWKDNNANGTFNTGDQLMANRIFKVKVNSTNKSYYIPTDNWGRYRMATGVDSLTAMLTNPPLYHTFSPSQFTHIFPTNNNTDTLDDVVLTPIPNISDMFVSLTPIHNPQTGLTTDYNLTYKNKGTVKKSGSVRMTWDATKQTFGSATPTPDTLTASYAAWKYTNMPSLASASIRIKFNIPTFPLGTPIQNIAKVYPFVGDQLLADNQDTSNLTFTWAPPNEIAVSDTLVDSTYMLNNGYLTYTLRFQNTGTDTANNILVASIHTGAGYDPTSFEPIAQSHPYKLIAPSDAAPFLQFQFDNVMLPNSGTNSAASYGFIKYRVKLLNPGSCQLWQAKANIYFDNNPVIETNTVQTRQALPIPTPTVSGLLSFCIGNSVVLTAPSGYSYTWLPFGLHTPTLTLTSPIGTVNHQLMIKKAAGCYATSLPIPVTIYPLPTTNSISSTGSLTFCEGHPTATLFANTVAGASYVWNQNGNPIAGATGTSYVPLQAGSYTFTLTDSNGCTVTSFHKSIIVNPLPIVEIAPTGTVNICTGDTLALTSTSSPNVTYQWQKNNNNIGGATSDSYKATTSGTYRLIVKSAAYCRDTSNATTSNFYTTVPVATISNVGELTFCEGGSVTLQASTGTSYTYTWYESGLAIGGANNNSYIATESGNYTVSISKNGCPKTSTPKIVTVNPLPVIPLISQKGNTLFSTSTNANEWFLNGDAITGATDSSYYATESGTYTVKITDGYGCSSTSNPYTFHVEAINLAQSLHVYPNPASQNIYIHFEKASENATSIFLTNDLGQIVYEKNIAEIGNIEMTIDVANFAEGVYRLELKGEEGQASKNIVVLKL